MTSSVLWRLQVRGLLARRPWVPTVGVFIAVLGVAVSCKFGVAEPRKKAYADFFRKMSP